MIRDNALRIKERIRSACERAKRDQNSVAIVAISKGRTSEQIIEALQAGITDIGENKVQEALLKYRQLPAMNNESSTIKWHMVGHLQKNKVKDAVKIFDLIQSVDSELLAEEIDRQAARINKIQDILLEIKTSPEDTKFGLKPDGAVEVLKRIAGLKNINIKGLMTMAPLVDNPEKAQPYFSMLRELRDKMVLLSTMNHELSTLSMGMTDDFETAIQEGSTMVRLGRAIFEA